jgi:hypothetical protein
MKANLSIVFALQGLFTAILATPVPADVNAVNAADNENSVDMLHCKNCWNKPENVCAISL